MPSRAGKQPSGALPADSFERLSVDGSESTLVDLLSEKLLMSPEDASDLIDFGSVQVNGRQERDPKASLEIGSEVRIYWPRRGTRRHYEVDPARILYRDRYLIAYDKEPGIPSQQTPADGYNNLFAALERFLKTEGCSSTYVAMHHRLDQETSGVMVFSLDRGVNKRMGSDFENRRVTKDYLAWVEGCPPRGHWTSTEDISRRGGRYCTCPKGEGKAAETEFRVLHREGADRSLVWARPKTGRTHQIRLHLAAAGHPILGDRLYGKGGTGRLHLHAYRLTIPHPVKKSPLRLTAPPPLDWPEAEIELDELITS